MREDVELYRARVVSERNPDGYCTHYVLRGWFLGGPVPNLCPLIPPIPTGFINTPLGETVVDNVRCLRENPSKQRVVSRVKLERLAGKNR